MIKNLHRLASTIITMTIMNDNIDMYSTIDYQLGRQNSSLIQQSMGKHIAPLVHPNSETTSICCCCAQNRSSKCQDLAVLPAQGEHAQYYTTDLPAQGEHAQYYTTDLPAQGEHAQYYTTDLPAGGEHAQYYTTDAIHMFKI